MAINWYARNVTRKLVDGDLQDVAHIVRVQIINDETGEAYAFNASLNEPDANNFTSFDALTQEDLVTFVKSSMTAEEIADVERYAGGTPRAVNTSNNVVQGLPNTAITEI